MKVVPSVDKINPSGNTAIALGLFDGVHIGHRAVIKEVIEKKHDGLIPGVFTFSFDTVLDSKKNFKYIYSENIKKKLLIDMGIEYMVSLEFNEVKKFSADEFVEKILVEKLKVKFVSCGYDFRFGYKARGTAAMLKQAGEQYGFDVSIKKAVVDGGDIASSTRIRQLIQIGDMKKANKMLAMPFMIEVIFVTAEHMKNRPGFFTITKKFPKGCLVPRNGVYLGVTTINGKRYPVEINIYERISTNEPEKLFEAHIIDYPCHLYGLELTIEIYDFIRPELRFKNIELLKRQVMCDINQIRQMYKDMQIKVL